MKLRKVFFSMLACALSLVFMFAFAACDTNKGPKVDSVKLDVTTVTLGPGDTQRLKATVTLSDGTEGEVEEWTSSAENVATVTRGVVAAKAAGTATITAKAGDKTATCTVTVENITVEINKPTLSLERGSEETLTATVKKDGSAVATETVDWASSDELIATVDENGKVTALREGSATITATRHGANQKATCEVTVTWTKPAGYEAIEYYEQNKVPTNKWGYWNDPANYVGGKSEMIEAYYQDSTEGSEAGKINLTFKVDERDGGANNSSIIQITYRSSKGQDGGKLEVNHNYRLDFTLTSSVAGKIEMNTIGKDPKPEATEIVAGENNLSVEFRHGDWGVNYPAGNYDNVESAAFFLLGLLGAPGETVNVSIDKLHWTDLGEADKKTEKPDFSTKIPDMSGATESSLTLVTDGIDTDKYDIKTTDEGNSYTVKYTNVESDTYERIIFTIPEGANVANCNTFAFTIKNDGTETMKLRLDLNGTVATKDPGGTDIFECAVKSVAEGASTKTDTQWGGTTISIEAGATATIYITYQPDGEHGTPVEMQMCFDTAYENEAHNKHSGNVTIGGFKFKNVTAE